MKNTILLLLCLFMLLPVWLGAQDNAIDATSLLSSLLTSQNDSLLNSVLIMGHANWSQAGLGLSYKQIMVMYNQTVLPAAKNFQADSTNAVLAGMDSQYFDIYYKYSTVMVGYIFRMGKRTYPYIGLGTAIQTEMIEIDAPDAIDGVYTIKGKEFEYGATGIAGIVYQFRKNLVLTGSVQYKPLLPFVGIGLVF